MQTDLLNKLRDEMRQLDSDIMLEEARLSDYKRQTTKDWMALKFGGLLEFAQKVVVSTHKDWSCTQLLLIQYHPDHRQYRQADDRGKE